MPRFLFALASLSLLTSPVAAAGQDPSILWPAPGRAVTWTEVGPSESGGRLWYDAQTVYRSGAYRTVRLRRQEAGVPEIHEAWFRFDCNSNNAQVVSGFGPDAAPIPATDWAPYRAEALVALVRDAVCAR